MKRHLCKSVLICLFISTALATQPASPGLTLMQTLQELLGATPGVKAIQAYFTDGTTQTVTQIVVTPATAPATKPSTAPTTTPATRPIPPIAVTHIIQAKNHWAHVNPPDSTRPLIVQDELLSDGGGVLAQSTAPVYVTHLSNQKPNNAPGGYYALAILWPNQASDGSQRAVSKAVFDETGCTIYQGAGEAIFRSKCDDCTVIGGTYVAHLGADGNQVKPLFEIRHGKKHVFEYVAFKGGYPEIGEQQTRQPDGSSKYETSQHPGDVVFYHSTFDTWTPAHNVYARKPGITGHVTFINCIDPDGKVFSRTE